MTFRRCFEILCHFLHCGGIDINPKESGSMHTSCNKQIIPSRIPVGRMKVSTILINKYFQMGGHNIKE